MQALTLPGSTTVPRADSEPKNSNALLYDAGDATGREQLLSLMPHTLMCDHLGEPNRKDVEYGATQ